MIVKAIHGKKVLFMLGGALVLCACLFIGGKEIVSAASEKRDLPIYNVDKEEKICSLSFDAAWGNEDTQLLIDILGKEDIKATFFVVGQWVDKYPESVKALADAGHEIMNHSDTHPHMTQLSREQILMETNQCNDKIEKITGVRPTLLRPPYGDYDNKLVSTLRSIGMYTIQWNIDSLDWKNLDANEITQRVVKRIEPGSIILFHNAAKNTPAALPSIITSLKEQGYGFTKISDIIYKEDFTVDHAGKQIPNTKN